MKRKNLFLILPAILSTIISCCSFSEIEPLPVTNRDNTPCNLNALEETGALLRYIADLSEDPFRGVISGQSCGHTYNLPDSDDLMGFSRQAGKIYNDTGKWPGIIAVDYGHDRISAPEALTIANQILIDYWNAGGLVAVGWSPLNPWLNDELDLVNNPGNWTDTRIEDLTEEQLAMIDLNKLIDPEEAIHVVWKRKLDRIAAALQELEEAGVVVLFKPLQEQNGFWFWWGYGSHPDDPDPYINLYRDMFDYFTNDKGLDNILWLYSPSSFPPDISAYIRPQLWVYPGDNYVDIVAPTAYNHFGNIYGYPSLVDTGKPMAMAEMGPDHENNTGHFDNRIYIRRVSEEYTGMAFWISWHDWSNGDGTNTYMSIGRNDHAGDLMNHPLVITRNGISWQDYMSEL